MRIHWFVSFIFLSIFSVRFDFLQMCFNQYPISGEDGVEISIPGDKAPIIVEALLNSTQANVQFGGLGARDSLRLEAGLCLYGNDIDQDTSPIEAGLAWLVGNYTKTLIFKICSAFNRFIF